MSGCFKVVVFAFMFVVSKPKLSIDGLEPVCDSIKELAVKNAPSNFRKLTFVFCGSILLPFVKITFLLIIFAFSKTCSP